MRRSGKSGRSQHPRIAHSSKKGRTDHQEPDKTTAREQPSASVEVTPKKALAEAIRHLGADVTHAQLVQFAKKRFGLDLQFVIIIPKTASQGGRASHSRVRRKAC
jgi:hypothetical protein